MKNKQELISNKPMYRYKADKSGKIQKTVYTKYRKVFDALREITLYVLGRETYVEEYKVGTIVKNSLFTFEDNDEEAVKKLVKQLRIRSASQINKTDKNASKARAEATARFADEVKKGCITEKKASLINIYAVMRTKESKPDSVEAVFVTKETAKEYVQRIKRKNLKEDRDYEFVIQPWQVSEVN